MTDTTPAALERIVESIRPQKCGQCKGDGMVLRRAYGDTADCEATCPICKGHGEVGPRLELYEYREAAAVIAALGAERDASVTALRSVVTANVENMRLASSAEATLREIAGIADSTIRAHTSGSDACHRILAIARTVGEKDNA